MKPLNIVLADGSVNTVEKEGDYDFEVGIIVDADWYGDHSGLKISGKGRLTASGSKYGIDANGNINVEGCDVRASGGNGAGIHSYDGSIVIRGGSVNASSTNDNAIVATEAVTIDGASVEAFATDDNSIGILSYYSNVIIKAGSIVTASGDDQAIKCKYEGSVINYIDGTGWTDKDGSQGETAIPISTEGQTLTFKKVQFPAKVDKVTVEFDSAGGSAVKAQTINKGAKATKPADPTKDGYTFDGWYNGNTAFDFNTAVNESITLTAHWKENAQPAPSGESSSAPESAVILINTKTVNANAMNVAAVQSGASFNSATVVVLGKNVKKISKGSFKNFRNVKTLVVQSKKLKKSSVKKSLKGSAVKKVKVQVGKKKTNKKYVKKYKRIFTKKNCGKKVKVSL